MKKPTEIDSSGITNTTRLYEEQPLEGLRTAMEDQRPGRRPGQFIEDMEARGAAELAATTNRLPKDGSEHPAWAAMGVVFGAPVAGDEMFREVKLPAGWKIQRTEHSMWTKLVDEKGRERASIFYKAAFYDRSAHVQLERRFTVDTTYPDSGPRVARALDCKKVLHIGTAFAAGDWAAADVARKEMSDWLVAKYPDCDNPVAYWELP